MKAFMDDDFLLSTETARTLYHAHAAKMPVIDYHCHIDPKEIWENRRFANITEAWLTADHYKWRVMRSNGVPEELVTGRADPREKFRAYAAVMDKCIGNPLYHWTHLELRRYFDYAGVLSAKTADAVWELCNGRLRSPGMSVRELISRSNVRLLCTTDDPADSLEYHRLLAGDASFKTQVLPAFRPDRSIHLTAPDFAAYIGRLSAAAGRKITGFAELKSALIDRIEYFDRMGCAASDHSLEYAVFSPAGEEETDRIFKKALAGDPITGAERDGYQTSLLLFLGREYAKRGWVMQLHLGPVRNTNARIFSLAGPDAGCDCMGPALDARPLTAFLNALDRETLLPKTILYSLNPCDNAMLGSVIGCFQNSDAAGKLQHGSAWWFNDTKSGMREQLTSLASSSLLGNFVGMLTDSRSFLSYPRHEYFRRILCGLIGEWVENGEYPADMELLGTLVEDISYNNTARYFGFKIGEIV